MTRICASETFVRPGPAPLAGAPGAIAIASATKSENLRTVPPETTPASVRKATHNSIGSKGIRYEVRYQVMGAKPSRLAERPVRARGPRRRRVGFLVSER